MLQNSKVSVNDFLEVLLGDPSVPCLVWLPLVHRIAAAEQGIVPMKYLNIVNIIDEILVFSRSPRRMCVVQSHSIHWAALHLQPLSISM